jgi:hypothetical protein
MQLLRGCDFGDREPTHHNYKGLKALSSSWLGIVPVLPTRVEHLFTVSRWQRTGRERWRRRGVARAKRRAIHAWKIRFLADIFV